MCKREICLLSTLMLLLGILLGFLCSPIKHGLNIGNNSGNTNYGKDDDDLELDDSSDDIPF